MGVALAESLVKLMTVLTQYLWAMFFWFLVFKRNYSRTLYLRSCLFPPVLPQELGALPPKGGDTSGAQQVPLEPVQGQWDFCQEGFLVGQ